MAPAALFIMLPSCAPSAGGGNTWRLLLGWYNLLLLDCRDKLLLPGKLEKADCGKLLLASSLCLGLAYGLAKYPEDASSA